MLFRSQAFEQTVPVIIDCPVDYGENTKLTENLAKIYAKLHEKYCGEDEK